MPRPVLPLALAALAVPALPAAADQVELAQLTIRQRTTVVRVPRMAPPPPVEWREKKGPRCIPVDRLAGAIVQGRDQVDLVMRGGGRVRAKMDGGCRGLNFYTGFYLKPADDGMVCADRDVLRSRAGAKCEIDGFRGLEPKK